MKKRLLAAAVAAAMAMSMGVVMAAPVEFDGSAQVHYRWNDSDANGTSESARSTFLLNAKLALDANTDLYARFATQRLHAGLSSADFRASATRDSISTIDRFGVILKGDNVTYNLGRQGATIGATALLYSTEGYIGSNMGSIDGVSASTKLGATNLNFIAGVENGYNNYNVGGPDNKVYSVHGSYNPAKNWTVGGTLARYDVDGGDTTNHWALDAAFNQGKVGYFAEYTKSNADDNNQAYVLGASYAFDAKNSFSAMYSKVEANGDMGGWTDFDPSGKGMYYSYNHKLTQDTTFNVFYKDMEEVHGTDNYNSFRTTVTYKF
ncbi:MAG: porin [Negativicutes bacterium]|nr:porin [Negativicutes bacterium]